MKKLFGFFVCLVICFPFANADTDYYAYSYARMSYVSGDVYIQRAGDLGYEQGVVNLAIVEGDKLGTKEGRTEIHFGRKNYLRIDRFTQIDMIGLPKQGLDAVKLHLLSGNIYLRVNYLEREKDFEIHTPDASFYVLQEGLYSLNVQENSETEFRVLEGMAEAAGETGSLMVEAEQRVIVSNGSFLSEPAYFSGLGEDFSEWNRSRDALHSRPASTSYLPSELSEYETELSDNGRWVYERPYGHVWVPAVYHDTWSPYWNGRWVWYPIIGWTWVSYDSWGWCVSHYGRWHWRIGLGWYWIPTRHWGPAWVHWYHGYDYYGWCPLSYYGYPGVIINNYFYGRYYNHYYPVHSRSFVMVRRDHFRSHRISKYALSQSARRRVGKVRLSSLQPKIRPQIDRTKMRNSPAAKVLARTDIRRVNKSYSSKNLAVSSGRLSSTKVRTIPGKAGGSSLIRKGTTAGKTSLTRGTSPSVTKARTSSLSPSQPSGRVISKTARDSQSRSSLKIYPSQRSNVSRSAISSSNSFSRSTVKSRALPSSSSRISKGSSSEKTIKSYASRNYSSSARTSQRTARTSTASSSRVTSSSRISSPVKRSSTTRVSPSRATGSAISRIYRSRSTATSSGRTKSTASSSRYSAPSRSSVSSRSYSSTRSSIPSRSYTSRSSSSSRVSTPSRTYSTSSRSSSRSRVSSPKISSSSSRSSSRSRVTSSRSSSSQRSSSPSRVSRSSRSSSRSSGKVRKK